MTVLLAFLALGACVCWGACLALHFDALDEAKSKNKDSRGPVAWDGRRHS